MRRTTPFLAAALAVTALAVTALAVTACFSGTPAPAEPAPAKTATVQASGTSNVFSPQITTVSQGGTVTWSFSTRTHNVTFIPTTGAPTNVPNSSNTNVSRDFTTPGTYAYACGLHPGMIGTVVVK